MHKEEPLERLSEMPLDEQLNRLNEVAAEKKRVLDSIGEGKKLLIQDYVIKLRKKFPQMKEARLMRKTAEYFRIKLI